MLKLEKNLELLNDSHKSSIIGLKKELNRKTISISKTNKSTQIQNITKKIDRGAQTQFNTKKEGNLKKIASKNQNIHIIKSLSQINSNFKDKKRINREMLDELENKLIIHEKNLNLALERCEVNLVKCQDSLKTFCKSQNTVKQASIENMQMLSKKFETVRIKHLEKVDSFAKQLKDSELNCKEKEQNAEKNINLLKDQ
ncbi:MAG: hypothetical protein MHPSP_003960, partial [Paramarteilia canceri]